MDLADPRPDGGADLLRVVGRGVDTELYDPARRSAALRQRWGVEGEGPVCLYVGRVAAEKNLALVEKAFAAIQVWHPQAKMVWVGDGPSARQLAVDHPDHHFAGMRTGEDLAAHYASADLFLFPSLTETYGNVTPGDHGVNLLVAGKLDTATASMAKYWCSDLQCKVMDECVQLFGGYGYMAEYPIARLYADARIQRIYGGTTEIMKDLIARRLGA